MNLKVRAARLGLTNELLQLIERRVRFALSRFGPRVSRVSVLVEDVNGVRGGVDKRCEIAVSMGREGGLRAEAADAVIEAAIADATDRIGRAVQRKLELCRDVRRGATSRNRSGPLPDGEFQES